jgi:hypothetical protein
MSRNRGLAVALYLVGCNAGGDRIRQHERRGDDEQQIDVDDEHDDGAGDFLGVR